MHNENPEKSLKYYKDVTVECVRYCHKFQTFSDLSQGFMWVHYNRILYTNSIYKNGTNFLLFCNNLYIL